MTKSGIFRGSLLAGWPVQLGGLAYAVKDTFTGTNNDDITTSHTPDIAPTGAAWAVAGVADSSSGTIQTNQLRITDGGDGQLRGFTIQSNKADCTISIEFTGNSISPTGPGIYARDDGTDHLDIFWASWANTVYIYDTDGSTLDSDTLALGADDHAHITVTLKGSSITALFENITDGTNVTCTATSTNNLTATKHGIIARTVFGAGASDRFDNFYVTYME